MRQALPALLCSFGLLTLAACGGPQSGGGQADCERPSAARPSGELADDAACWLSRDDHAVAAEACREASAVASRLTPDAAGDFAVCVLRAGERSDGAWFSDFLAALSEEARLEAAIAGADAFDLATHANTFTAALPDAVQRSLAHGLDVMPEPARALYISLAMRYQLATLLEDVGPFVRELEADDPGLMGYAAVRVDSGEPLDEDDRWAAAASGYWTAEELFACWERELEGCETWTGTSPLELMAEPNVRPGHGTDPQRATEIIGRGNATPAEAEALTRFVAQSEYPNRSGMLNMLMLQLTDSSIDDEIRLAMARGASDEMCAMGVVLETMMRARSDEEILEDPSRPWPTFLRTCHETTWADIELGPAVASGSRLGAPLEDYQRYGRAFFAATQDLACDEALTMAEGTMAMIGNRAPQRGLALLALSESTGSRCDATFEAPILALSTDASAHPEARVGAIAWRVERGDTSACRQIDAAMGWYDEDLREGPSAWSETLAAEVRADCR